MQGKPYQLAGKRVIFANWYYIQPGDLDWRNKEGKSVYVKGDEGLFDAVHVGVNAPHGIAIMAQKPSVVGPFERPYRSLLHDGGIYKSWSSSEYWESKDGMHWEKKAKLVFDGLNEDGLGHTFIDPAGPAEERFKSVWVGHINRAQFEAYRNKRPDGWEPRALLLLGEKDEITCLRGSVSPDGVRWTTLPDPLVVEYCDTLNVAYYDATLKKYVLYTRYWSVGPRTERLPPDIRNSRRRSARHRPERIGRLPPVPTIRDDSRTKPRHAALRKPLHQLPHEHPWGARPAPDVSDDLECGD